MYTRTARNRYTYYKVYLDYFMNFDLIKVRNKKLVSGESQYYFLPTMIFFLGSLNFYIKKIKFHSLLLHFHNFNCIFNVIWGSTVNIKSSINIKLIRYGGEYWLAVNRKLRINQYYLYYYADGYCCFFSILFICALRNYHANQHWL